MYPQKSSKIVDKSNNEQVCNTVPVPVLKTESPTFHDEPMEDVFSTSKSAISKFTSAYRQDSGFSESKA
ncbi:11573_t:CDS:1, partial [Dentiscutata heterogama]